MNEYYKVGDLVIAKWDIGKSGVLAGDVLPVLAVKYCKCGNQSIDVGITEPGAVRVTCTICDRQQYLIGDVERDDVWYLNAYNFALYEGERYNIEGIIYRPTDNRNVIEHLKIVNN